MVERSPKSEWKLRLALTLIIPAFIGFVTWKSQASQSNQPSVNDDPQKQTGNQEPFTFANTVATPGPGVWKSTDSGLKYMDLTVGQGPTPQTGQRVFFLYAVRLENGKVVAANRLDLKKDDIETLTYVYGYVSFPPAWAEAVSTMRVGGWRRFVLPPDQAAQIATLGSGIPTGAPLIVDAQLLYLNPTILPNDSF